MKTIFYAKSYSHLEILAKLGVSEIILTPKNLSRFGLLTREEIKDCLSFNCPQNIKISIEWDILMTEDVLEQAISEVNEYLSLGVKSFRVKDIGALNFLLHKTATKISFYQGHSNQNIHALRFWKEKLGKRLDKIILSLECSKDMIQAVVKEFGTVEISLLSRVLLSYTPRKLLKNVNNEVRATSLEGPNKNFPVVQNQHGTFIFYMDDFSILDYLSEVREMSVSDVFLDTRFCSEDMIEEMLCQYMQKPEKELLENIYQKYKTKVTSGFFLENKTDEIFAVLKNKFLNVSQENLIGEVVDVKKDHYLGIHLKNRASISLDTKIVINTPDGKVKQLKLNFLKNSSWQDIDKKVNDGIVYINYFSGVTFKSLVSVFAS